MSIASLDLPLCTVIICTHNPRHDYLQRALGALRKQSLGHCQWELIIVDNASEAPVETWLDISWHPRGRLVREQELGLTPARLKGISEAKGDILIFVDDDNILGFDYLERALEIGEQWPMLGSWGAAIIAPEFEVVPAPSLQPYIRWLAIREERGNLWSNNPIEHSAVPWGAGLCVRRDVAKVYVDECTSTPLGNTLDRRGTSLASGGDALLALSARYLGLGWGVFLALNITHLIPAFRVTESYLLRMAEQMTESNQLLHYIVSPATYNRPRVVRNLVSWIFHNLRFTLAGDRLTRSIMNAAARGARRANRIIDGLQE